MILTRFWGFFFSFFLPFFLLQGVRRVCLCGFYFDEDLGYNPYICLGDPNSVKSFT